MSDHSATILLPDLPLATITSASVPDLMPPAYQYRMTLLTTKAREILPVSRNLVPQK